MAVQVYETFESGNGTVGGANPSRELRYTATGSELTLEVQQAVEAVLPAYLAGLFFDSYDLSHLGAGIWQAVARYGPRARPDPGQSPGGSGGSAPPNTSPRLSQAEREPALGGYSESFDTGGGTRKLKQSYATKFYNRPDVIGAPDFKGVIAAKDGDGDVEGVEVVSPVFSWSETHHLATAAVKGGYKKVLYELTGTVNDAVFRGFNTGEVLFMGASGSGKWSDGWEVTFKFSAQPSVVGLQVGDITGITKLGWEYLWVLHDVQEDKKRLVKRAHSVYIETVYKYSDFGRLGLGTT